LTQLIGEPGLSIFFTICKRARGWKKFEGGARGRGPLPPPPKVQGFSGALAFHRGFYFEAVFIDFGLEGGSGQAQEFGGLAAVSPGEVEGFLDNQAGKTVDKKIKNILL
jgi:hypothetical protein